MWVVVKVVGWVQRSVDLSVAWKDDYLVACHAEENNTRIFVYDESRDRIAR